MRPGAFILLLRPTDGEDFEVLLQYRAKHLSNPQTWGLVGGQLEYDEWWIYDSQRVSEDVRQRVLRRAALREALEEMGAVPEGSKMPYTPIVFEPLCVQVAADGQAMRLPRQERRWPVPAGLSFLENDPQRSKQLRVENSHTYVFVYLIDPLRDGEIFMGDKWQPQEPRGGEVDQSKGTFGYQWRPLSCFESDEDLQPWVQRLGQRHQLQQLALQLQLPRPKPEIGWKDGPIQELQLLALAFESGLQWRQCDQNGCTLKEWAEEKEILKSTVKYFQEEQPMDFKGPVWSGKAARVLRLCAEAVQKKGSGWEEQRDLKKFTLKDWEDWDFGDEAKQKVMKERGLLLRQFLRAMELSPAPDKATTRRWKT